MDRNYLTRKNLKFGFIALCVIAVILFNQAHESEPSPEIKALNQWIGKVVEARNTQGAVSPTSLATLSSVDPARPFNWSLEGSSPEDADKFVRVIELVREAAPKRLRVLMPGETALPAREDELLLTVSGEGQNFEARISRKEFESNVKIQNLVKLFQLADLAHKNRGRQK